MGLSGRRRAKKETVIKPSIQQQAGSSQPDEVSSQQPLHRRTGNTLRRVCPRTARDQKRAHLLAFDVSHGSEDADDLLPARPPKNSADVGVEPNGNRYNKHMVRLAGNDFSSGLSYSLNKRSRWQFPQHLLADCEVNESLKRQNITLAESVTKLRGSRVTSLTTNTLYMAQAVAELREHKNLTLRDQAKRRLAPSDRFNFSEDVQLARAQRRMTKKVAPVGYVNAKSIQQSCQPRKKLDGLSPSAEKARQHLDDDFNGRARIVVGTCVPSQEASATRYRQAERENPVYRQYVAVKNFPYRNARLIDRMERQERCSRMELQLEMDGASISQDEVDVLQAEADAAVEVRPHRQLSLCDVLWSKTDISANKARKLAMKTEKTREKLRSYSGQTADSSGYESACETTELEGAQQSAAEPDAAADMRLSLAVQVELAVDRLLVQVPLEAAATDRLIGLFGNLSGAEQALVIGNSVPRKLGVLLRSDLSESVVFEEAAATLDSTNQELATFAVHYSVSDTVAFWKRKTSAEEVAAQVDPFAFLRGLVEPPTSPLAAVEKPLRAATVASAVGCWKVAATVTESAARMIAIRALPMFGASASESVSDDAVVIPSAECEICFQELWQTNEPASSKPWGQGSTMLGACGHHFCNRCWVQHVASSVAQGRSKVTCPGFECQSVVDAATLLWFCPCSLLPALASGAYRNWLSERRGRRACSRAKCGRILEAPSGVNAVCGACSQRQCLGCGQEPHWPIDCGTAAKFQQKMQAFGHAKLSLTDLEAVAQVNAKQCPTCRIIMEKGVGCNHMSCPCGENFCWWCGRALRDHANGSACSREPARRSDYLIEQSFSARDSVLKPNSLQSRLYCEAVKIHLARVQMVTHLSADRLQLAELIETSCYRFQSGGSRRDARRQAELQADELVSTVTQAAYLIEFAYAQADSRQAGRRFSRLVRSLGGLAWHLTETIAAEVRGECRSRFSGRKRTKETLERLQTLLVHLRTKCSLLHSLTAGLGRSRSLKLTFL